jgi:hypothetical protein
VSVYPVNTQTPCSLSGTSHPRPAFRDLSELYRARNLCTFARRRLWVVVDDRGTPFAAELGPLGVHSAMSAPPGSRAHGSGSHSLGAGLDAGTDDPAAALSFRPPWEFRRAPGGSFIFSPPGPGAHKSDNNGTT